MREYSAGRDLVMCLDFEESMGEREADPEAERMNIPFENCFNGRRSRAPFQWHVYVPLAFLSKENANFNGREKLQGIPLCDFWGNEIVNANH